MAERQVIRVRRVWQDDDMAELLVDATTDTARVAVEVYVGWQDLRRTVGALSEFKGLVHGGLYDLQWGRLGPEYANGAIDARFHFVEARLHITWRAQSDYFPFGRKNVANESVLHLHSEPALLDRFIIELGLLASGDAEEAVLELTDH